MTLSQRWTDEIVPYVELPTQRTPGRTWTPELALVLAVLADALKILAGSRAHFHDVQTIAAKRELRDETRAWFRSNRMDHPFSFLRCCEVLALEPLAIREFALVTALHRAWDPESRRHLWLVRDRMAARTKRFGRPNVADHRRRHRRRVRGAAGV